MTKLVLDLTKSIDENATVYFEKAKKIKRKIEGAEKALESNLKKLKELEAKRDKFLEKTTKYSLLSLSYFCLSFLFFSRGK